VDKIQSLLHRLSDLDDSHAEFVLLRFCLSLPKIAYSLRTCPTQLIENVLRRFDDLQREALSVIVGHPLHDASWSQASLPINMGGMGIRSAVCHAPAAYIASRSSTKTLVSKITGGATLDDQMLDSLARLRQWSGRDNWLTLENVDVPLTQHSLSQAIDSNLQEQLISSLSSAREKARFHSVSDSHSGDWLKVVPSPSLGLALSSAEFKFASLYRLGLPMYPESSSCSSCQQTNDSMGDHAVGCGGDRDRIARHDRLRDAIFNAAHSAALAPRMEVAGLIPGSNSRPADVFLPSWENGKAAAIDVTVISSLQKALIRDSASTPGFALQVAESRKRQTYGDALGRDVALLPLAVDVFGRWSASSVDFINRLGHFLRLRENGSAGHLFQRLSVLLQKGNGALWGRRFLDAPPFVSGFY
jgi:hypothetical protein